MSSYLDAFLSWLMFMSVFLGVYLLRRYFAKSSVKFQKDSFGIEITQAEMERRCKIISIAGAVVFSLIFLLLVIGSILKG